MHRSEATKFRVRDRQRQPMARVPPCVFVVGLVHGWCNRGEHSGSAEAVTGGFFPSTCFGRHGRPRCAGACTVLPITVCLIFRCKWRLAPTRCRPQDDHKKHTVLPVMRSPRIEPIHDRAPTRCRRRRRTERTCTPAASQQTPPPARQSDLLGAAAPHPFVPAPPRLRPPASQTGGTRCEPRVDIPWTECVSWSLTGAE
jgi:hypothetical protein